MRTVLVFASATVLLAGVAGCSSTAAADDLVVGDCVKIGGPPDRPEATRAECGSTESNFRVVAAVAETNECPTDIDSYLSMRGSFSDSRNTACLDIDWVVGQCMSIDPEQGRDPLRVDCADTTAPGRQRATEIISDVANVDQCVSGVGYAYEERDFTVCVEDIA